MIDSGIQDVREVPDRTEMAILPAQVTLARLKSMTDSSSALLLYCEGGAWPLCFSSVPIGS